MASSRFTPCAVALALIACRSPDERAGVDAGSPHGPSGGSDAGVPAQGRLRILPGDVEVVVSDGRPATVTYSLVLEQPDAAPLDVTAEAMFSLNHTALGTFAGSVLTTGTTQGGRTTVYGNARGLQAQTSLVVRVEKVVIGPGAPPDAPDRFAGGGAPTGSTPELVYPADGVMVPANTNVLELQFRPGAGHDLFRITFNTDQLALTVYLTCNVVGGGCVYTPEEAEWMALAETARGRAPISWSVAGVQGRGTPQVSDSRRLSFSQEDIVGGLYYWNARAGAVRRFEFGGRRATAENFMDGPRAGAFACVGCHVLSRDGRKMAVGMDIPAPSPYKVFDVATRTAAWNPTRGANFFAFSPNASQYLASDSVTIGWFDAGTGAVIQDRIADGAMPDWSPDGTRMVFAKPNPAQPFPAPGISGGSLEVMPFAAGAWGASTTLVPYAGENNFYPSFSPDGEWVIFNRSTSGSFADDWDAARKVWVVPAAGGTPVQLAAASGGGDSWPKWAPDVQLYQGRSLLWFTVSSKRPRGLRGSGEVQLWMAAFDPERARRGEDPSYPPFWLPFQEPDSHNLIAQWVTEVVRQPCMSTMECGPGEFCIDGSCEPGIGVTADRPARDSARSSR